MASEAPKDPPPRTQQVEHNPVTARVPEKVARGVYSNAVVILQGQHEFVLDFLLRMANPHQIVARVVLPMTVVPAIINAIRENLAMFQAKSAPPAPSAASAPAPAAPESAAAPPAAAAPAPAAEKPAAPADRGPSIPEIYEHLKLADDQLSGVYANSLMIVHSAAEFGFDFITTFYPRPAVACRVFMAAPQVPAFLSALSGAYQQYAEKLRGR